MQSLISIITPYYNGKKYLKKFLNNLKNQSSNNFELIIVDDCSKESEYNYLQKTLKNYNFKYYIYRNKNNSGPGVTRNVGIKHANGEYLTFVDSDDNISNDFVAKITDIINNNTLDLIIMDYYAVKENKEKVVKTLPTNDIKLNKDFTLAMSKGMCWSKVYQKKLIIDHKIKFPKLMRSEDLAFVKVYISKCQEIYYLQEALYYYNDNATSIMHRKDTLNINNNIEAYNYIEDNVIKNEALEMVFIREYLYLIVQIMIIKEYSNKDIKEFIHKNLENHLDWSKNKYLKYQPLYLKIILFFIKYKMILPIRLIFKFKR